MYVLRETKRGGYVRLSSAAKSAENTQGAALTPDKVLAEVFTNEAEAQQMIAALVSEFGTLTFEVEPANA